MVPSSKRGTNKFEILIKAQKLCVYTLKICTNEKVFIHRYNALTNELMKISQDIFINLTNANRTNLFDEYELRKSKITKAIELCDDFLSLIQIAKPVFHLSSKRIKYWANQIVEVQRLSRELKKSDKGRYRKQANTECALALD